MDRMALYTDPKEFLKPKYTKEELVKIQNKFVDMRKELWKQQTEYRSRKT